jgi:hypothetical protein
VFEKSLVPSTRTSYRQEPGKGAILTGTSFLHDLQEEIIDLAISPKLILAAASDGIKRADMYDLYLGEWKACVVLSEDIRRLACSPGTRKIAFAGCNGMVGIWDPTTGIVKKAPESRFSHLYCVAMRPDGQAMFYGGTNGLVKFRYTNDVDNGSLCSISGGSTPQSKSFHGTGPPRSTQANSPDSDLDSDSDSISTDPSAPSYLRPMPLRWPQEQNRRS